MLTHRAPFGLRATLVSVFAAALIAGAAHADDRMWNTPFDGNFGDGFNWDDGEQPAPGPEDSAVFDVAADFTVTFVENQTTDRVRVRDGFVTFQFDPSIGYTLLNELSTTPGVAVGVGDGDIASLTLRGGIMHAVFTDVGDGADAFGELTIDAGWLQNEQQLTVGNQGVGFFHVLDQGAATNGIASVGLLGGSYGVATVGGFQSEWSCDGALTIGKGGVGELLVDDGGYVACHDAVIAQRTSSRGAATVRGAESDWLVDGTLDVGMNGVGSLAIEDGAKVIVRDFATVGTFPGNPEEEPQGDGGLGDVVVDGANSIWSVEGDLYVPFLGRGTLVMAAGGTVVVQQGDFFPSLLGEEQEPLVFGLAHADDYPFAAMAIAGIVSKDADSPGARVVLVDGFEPIEGDHFVLMEAASGVDVMTLSLPELTDPLEWLVTQTSTELTITAVIGTSCQGDIDLSGSVDFNDLLVILDEWGPCPDCPGDLNDDDAVDFDDLLIVLEAWGPCP